MLGGVILAGLVAGRLVAETVSIPAAADTSLFAVNPGNNLGALLNVPLGPVNQTAGAGGSIAEGRVLMRFDVASRIPPGAVVTRAQLEFSVVKERFSGPALEVELRRMLVPWAEGTGAGGNSGTTAKAGEPSWNQRSTGDGAWGAPGGLAGVDFAPAPSATGTIDNVAKYTFASTPGLVSDVQAWLSGPGSNHGWILMGRSPQVRGSAKRIDTREGSAPVPNLVVEYTVPPPPELRFASVGLAGERVELRFRGEPGNIYEIQHATDPAATQWQALTNYIVKLQPLDAVASDEVTGEARFYRIAITGQVD